jgi:hypothetical protein
MNDNMNRKKLDLGKMNVYDYLKSRIKLVAIIGMILSFAFIVIRGYVAFSDGFINKAIVYLTAAGLYILPTFTFIIRKEKYAPILFLSIYSIMLICVQIVDFNNVDFANLIIVHSESFVAVTIITGFLVGRISAVVIGTVGVVDILLMSYLSGDEVLNDYLVSMLGPQILVTIAVFYFTGLLNSLIFTTSYEAKSSKEKSEKLKQIVDMVTESVNSFEKATKDISDGTQDLSQRTNQQAASLQEITSSIEQLSANIDTNLSNTEKSKDTAIVIKESMQDLNKTSKDMVEIIQTIESIAFETNLLALNASIEAARAGDSGRGFEVVATQVKELSQRSATQSKEIRQIIEDNIDKVTYNLRMVEKNNDIIKEITLSSTEQYDALKQIAESIEQLNEMTQQNAELVSQAAVSTEEIASRAKKMGDLVNLAKKTFDINGDIEEVINKDERKELENNNTQITLSKEDNN